MGAILLKMLAAALERSATPLVAHFDRADIEIGGASSARLFELVRDLSAPTVDRQKMLADAADLLFRLTSAGRREPLPDG